jgi:peptidoglycan/LPS O-acetylase OafA/YrhL
MNSQSHPDMPPRHWPGRYLSDHLGSRDNRIDQLRLAAALLVVLGHSWYIALGRAAHVPFQDWTLFGFHSLAVHVFFFLSGLLVTESARRHKAAPGQYLRKRALRIFPALLANAVVVPIALVAVGAWNGVGVVDIARYTLRLVTLVSVQYDHPGAFAHSPFKGAINGSVWSLRHEIIVYLLVIGASMAGALANPRRRAVFLLLMFAYIVVGHLVAPFAKGGGLFLLAEGRHVMLSFLLGVAAHQFAARVPLHGVMLLPGAILLLCAQPLQSRGLAELAIVYLVCAGTLLLAFPRDKTRALPHDVSYGVYIYSWPIQQLTVFVAASAFGAALAPIPLFVISLGPLLIVALASWLWIERPALALASRTPKIPEPRNWNVDSRSPELGVSVPPN